MKHRLCRIFKRNRPFASRLSKSPLFFFLVGYAILKDFSYLFGAKFTGRKFYRWRHDNWPIEQWVIFHAGPNSAYVNHFFPAWIYNMIETSSLARSLRDLVGWSSLRSLLRPYERSTGSKSNLRVAQSLFQSKAKYKGIATDMKMI